MPSAVAAWTSAAVCLGLPGAGAIAVGMALVAGALLSVWRSRQAMAVVLIVAAAAALAAGLRVAHASAGTVPELAEAAAVVSADVVVGGDPRLIDATFGRQVVAEGAARSVTARGRTVLGRAPVLLLAPEDSGLLDVPLGATVRVVGRLATSDGVDLSALLLVSRVERVVQEPAWWWTAAGAVRAGVDRGVDGRGQPGELVPALVVGDDSGLAPELSDDFRASGLTHLLAVSGTNLTLVLSAVLLAARTVGVRGRGLTVVGVLGAVGFVLLARPEPSVVRAAAMGLVALAGLTAGDSRRGLRALSVAVLVLVLIDPWLARSVGFLLSALATAAILVLAPPWRDALLGWLPRWAAEAVAVPTAAQLVCTPVVAAISGQASVVAVLANVAAAPAVGPATVLGLLAGLVATALPRLGELLGWTAVAPAWWIVTVARLSARLPGAVVEWGTSLPALAGLAGLCALVGLVVHWGLRRRAAAIAVAVLLVVAVLRPLPSPGWPPSGWVFVACDVGQGDALVVPTGETSALVVDAGPDPAEVQDCLADLGIGSVTALVVTHLHADHVDGIRGVLGALPVAQLQVGPVRTPSESWAAVSAAAAAADVPIRTVAAGSGFSAGAVDWRVLAPPVTTRPDLSDDAGEGSPVNDASVVLLVEVGGVRLLLTGDVEPTGQQALLRTGVDLHADVLKVPHHGSQRQDPSFLAAVGAPLSVVSVGADNGYGHPAPALLAHLGTGADQVARTDQHGDVAVVVDDGQLGWVAR